MKMMETNMEMVDMGPQFFLAGQVAVADVGWLAANGIRTLVNNRPDGEAGANQPTSAQLRAEAYRYGMHYAHIPLRGLEPDTESIEEFARLYAVAPRPMLAFCRTGVRSRALYEAVGP